MAAVQYGSQNVDATPTGGQRRTSRSLPPEPDFKAFVDLPFATDRHIAFHD
jgi:hypothetical protein